MRAKISIAFLSILLLAVFTISLSIQSAEAGGCSRTWDNGGATTNWSEAANWVGDTVPPDDCDTVIIPGGFTVNLDVDYPSGADGDGISTSNVDVAATSELIIDSTFTMVISGGATFDGKLTANGTFENRDTGAVTVSSTGEVEVNSGGAYSNRSGGAATTTLDAGAMVTVNTGGTWNDNGSLTETINNTTFDLQGIRSGSGKFTNNLTLNISGTFAQVGGAFGVTTNNSGATITISSTGDLRIGFAGSVINKSGGQVTLETGGKITNNAATGGGFTNEASGTVTSDGNVINNNTFLNDGTFEEDCNHNVTGSVPITFNVAATDICPFVGGTFEGVDTTSLIVAGAQMNAAWMIPVIVAGIGFAIVIARKF